MIYYLAWIALLLAGIWISLGLFTWAIREGQFREQQRARYLPLRGEAGPTLIPKTRWRVEVWVALGIIVMGLSAMFAAVLTVLNRSGAVE